MAENNFEYTYKFTPAEIDISSIEGTIKQYENLDKVLTSIQGNVGKVTTAIAGMGKMGQQQFTGLNAQAETFNAEITGVKAQVSDTVGQLTNMSKHYEDMRKNAGDDADQLEKAEQYKREIDEYAASRFRAHTGRTRSITSQAEMYGLSDGTHTRALGFDDAEIMAPVFDMNAQRQQLQAYGKEMESMVAKWAPQVTSRIRGLVKNGNNPVAALVEEMNNTVKSGGFQSAEEVSEYLDAAIGTGLTGRMFKAKTDHARKEDQQLLKLFPKGFVKDMIKMDRTGDINDRYTPNQAMVPVVEAMIKQSMLAAIGPSKNPVTRWINGGVAGGQIPNTIEGLMQGKAFEGMFGEQTGDQLSYSGRSAINDVKASGGNFLTEKGRERVMKLVRSSPELARASMLARRGSSTGTSRDTVGFRTTGMEFGLNINSMDDVGALMDALATDYLVKLNGQSPNLNGAGQAGKLMPNLMSSARTVKSGSHNVLDYVSTWDKDETAGGYGLGGKTTDLIKSIRAGIIDLQSEDGETRNSVNAQIAQRVYGRMQNGGSSGAIQDVATSLMDIIRNPENVTSVQTSSKPIFTTLTEDAREKQTQMLIEKLMPFQSTAKTTNDLGATFLQKDGSRLQAASEWTPMSENGFTRALGLSARNAAEKTSLIKEIDWTGINPNAKEGSEEAADQEKRMHDFLVQMGADPNDPNSAYVFHSNHGTGGATSRLIRRDAYEAVERNFALNYSIPYAKRFGLLNKEQLKLSDEELIPVVQKEVGTFWNNFTPEGEHGEGGSIPKFAKEVENRNKRWSPGIDMTGSAIDWLNGGVDQFGNQLSFEDIQSRFTNGGASRGVLGSADIAESGALPRMALVNLEPYWVKESQRRRQELVEKYNAQDRFKAINDENAPKEQREALIKVRDRAIEAEMKQMGFLDSKGKMFGFDSASEGEGYINSEFAKSGSYQGRFGFGGKGMLLSMDDIARTMAVAQGGEKNYTVNAAGNRVYRTQVPSAYDPNLMLDLESIYDAEGKTKLDSNYDGIIDVSAQKDKGSAEKVFKARMKALTKSGMSREDAMKIAQNDANLAYNTQLAATGMYVMNRSDNDSTTDNIGQQAAAWIRFSPGMMQHQSEALAAKMRRLETPEGMADIFGGAGAKDNFYAQGLLGFNPENNDAWSFYYQNQNVVDAKVQDYKDSLMRRTTRGELINFDGGLGKVETLGNAAKIENSRVLTNPWTARLASLGITEEGGMREAWGSVIDKGVDKALKFDENGLVSEGVLKGMSRKDVNTAAQFLGTAQGMFSKTRYGAKSKEKLTGDQVMGILTMTGYGKEGDKDYLPAGFVDFDRTNMLQESFIRSPTGLGQVYSGINYGAIYGKDFQKLSGQKTGTLFNFSTMQQLAGADWDGDMIKVLTSGRYDMKRINADRAKSGLGSLKGKDMLDWIASEDGYRALRQNGRIGGSDFSIVDDIANTMELFKSMGIYSSLTERKGSTKDYISEGSEKAHGIKSSEETLSGNRALDITRDLMRRAYSPVGMGGASAVASRLSGVGIYDKSNTFWAKLAAESESLYDAYTTHAKRPVQAQMSSADVAALGLGQEFGKIANYFDGRYSVTGSQKVGFKNNGTVINPYDVFEHNGQRLYIGRDNGNQHSLFDKKEDGGFDIDRFQLASHNSRINTMTALAMGYLQQGGVYDDSMAELNKAFLTEDAVYKTVSPDSNEIALDKEGNPIRVGGGLGYGMLDVVKRKDGSGLDKTKRLVKNFRGLLGAQSGGKDFFMSMQTRDILARQMAEANDEIADYAGEIAGTDEASKYLSDNQQESIAGWRADGKTEYANKKEREYIANSIKKRYGWAAKEMALGDHEATIYGPDGKIKRKDHFDTSMTLPALMESLLSNIGLKFNKKTGKYLGSEQQSEDAKAKGREARDLVQRLVATMPLTQEDQLIDTTVSEGTTKSKMIQARGLERFAENARVMRLTPDMLPEEYAKLIDPNYVPKTPETLADMGFSLPGETGKMVTADQISKFVGEDVKGKTLDQVNEMIAEKKQQTEATQQAVTQATAAEQATVQAAVQATENLDLTPASSVEEITGSGMKGLSAEQEAKWTEIRQKREAAAARSAASKEAAAVEAKKNAEEEAAKKQEEELHPDYSKDIAFAEKGVAQAQAALKTREEKLAEARTASEESFAAPTDFEGSELSKNILYPDKDTSIKSREADVEKTKAVLAEEQETLEKLKTVAAADANGITPETLEARKRQAAIKASEISIAQHQQQLESIKAAPDSDFIPEDATLYLESEKYWTEFNKLKETDLDQALALPKPENLKTSWDIDLWKARPKVKSREEQIKLQEQLIAKEQANINRLQASAAPAATEDMYADLVPPEATGGFMFEDDGEYTASIASSRDAARKDRRSTSVTAKDFIRATPSEILKVSDEVDAELDKEFFATHVQRKDGRFTHITAKDIVNANPADVQKAADEADAELDAEFFATHVQDSSGRFVPIGEATTSAKDVTKPIKTEYADSTEYITGEDAFTVIKNPRERAKRRYRSRQVARAKAIQGGYYKFDKPSSGDNLGDFPEPPHESYYTGGDFYIDPEAMEEYGLTPTVPPTPPKPPKSPKITITPEDETFMDDVIGKLWPEGYKPPEEAPKSSPIVGPQITPTTTITSTGAEETESNAKTTAQGTGSVKVDVNINSTIEEQSETKTEAGSESKVINTPPVEGTTSTAPSGATTPPPTKPESEPEAPKAGNWRKPTLEDLDPTQPMDLATIIAAGKSRSDMLQSKYAELQEFSKFHRDTSNQVYGIYDKKGNLTYDIDAETGEASYAFRIAKTPEGTYALDQSTKKGANDVRQLQEMGLFSRSLAEDARDPSGRHIGDDYVQAYQSGFERQAESLLGSAGSNALLDVDKARSELGKIIGPGSANDSIEKLKQLDTAEITNLEGSIFKQEAILAGYRQKTIKNEEGTEVANPLYSFAYDADGNQTAAMQEAEAKIQTAKQSLEKMKEAFFMAESTMINSIISKFDEQTSAIQQMTEGKTFDNVAEANDPAKQTRKRMVGIGTALIKRGTDIEQAERENRDYLDPKGKYYNTPLGISYRSYMDDLKTRHKADLEAYGNGTTEAQVNAALEKERQSQATISGLKQQNIMSNLQMSGERMDMMTSNHYLGMMRIPFLSRSMQLKRSLTQNVYDAEKTQRDYAIKREEAQLKGDKASYDAYDAAYNAQGANVDKAKEQLKANTGIAGIAKSLGATAIGMAYTKLKQTFKKIINLAKQFVNQWNEAMAGISAKSGLSGDELQAVGDQIEAQATRLKVSATKLAETYKKLFAAGYDTSNIEHAAEVLTKFSKVTGQDITKSMRQLTQVVKSGLVDSLDEAVDKLTAISDLSTSSTADIAKVLSKMSGTATSLGMSSNETTGLAAFATDVLGGSSSAGNDLSLILQRMSQLNSDQLNAYGVMTDSEGRTYTSQQLTALQNSTGVTLTDLSGQMLEPFEMLKAIAEQWQDLTDVQRSSFTTLFGGSTGRQANTFTTLMNGLSLDPELLDKYVAAAENSEGTVDTQYASMTDSVNAARQQAQSAFTDFVSDLGGGSNGWFVQLKKVFWESITDIFTDSSQNIPTIDFDKYFQMNVDDLNTAIDTIEKIKEKYDGLTGTMEGTDQEAITSALNGIASAFPQVAQEAKKAAESVEGLDEALDYLIETRDKLTGDKAEEIMETSDYSSYQKEYEEAVKLNSYENVANLFTEKGSISWNEWFEEFSKIKDAVGTGMMAGFINGQFSQYETVNGNDTNWLAVFFDQYYDRMADAENPNWEEDYNNSSVKNATQSPKEQLSNSVRGIMHAIGRGEIKISDLDDTQYALLEEAISGAYEEMKSAIDNGTSVDGSRTYTADEIAEIEFAKSMYFPLVDFENRQTRENNEAAKTMLLGIFTKATEGLVDENGKALSESDIFSTLFNDVINSSAFKDENGNSILLDENGNFRTDLNEGSGAYASAMYRYLTDENKSWISGNVFDSNKYLSENPETGTGYWYNGAFIPGKNQDVAYQYLKENWNTYSGKMNLESMPDYRTFATNSSAQNGAATLASVEDLVLSTELKNQTYDSTWRNVLQTISSHGFAGFGTSVFNENDQTWASSLLGTALTNNQNLASTWNSYVTGGKPASAVYSEMMKLYLGSDLDSILSTASGKLTTFYDNYATANRLINKKGTKTDLETLSKWYDETYGKGSWNAADQAERTAARTAYYNDVVTSQDWLPTTGYQLEQMLNAANYSAYGTYDNLEGLITAIDTYLSGEGLDEQQITLANDVKEAANFMLKNGIFQTSYNADTRLWDVATNPNEVGWTGYSDRYTGNTLAGTVADVDYNSALANAATLANILSYGVEYDKAELTQEQEEAFTSAYGSEWTTYKDLIDQYKALDNLSEEEISGKYEGRTKDAAKKWFETRIASAANALQIRANEQEGNYSYFSDIGTMVDDVLLGKQGSEKHEGTIRTTAEDLSQENALAKKLAENGYDITALTPAQQNLVLGRVYSDVSSLGINEKYSEATKDMLKEYYGTGGGFETTKSRFASDMDYFATATGLDLGGKTAAEYFGYDTEAALKLTASDFEGSVMKSIAQAYSGGISPTTQAEAQSTLYNFLTTSQNWNELLKYMTPDENGQYKVSEILTERDEIQKLFTQLTGISMEQVGTDTESAQTQFESELGKVERNRSEITAAKEDYGITDEFITAMGESSRTLDLTQHYLTNIDSLCVDIAKGGTSAAEAISSIGSAGYKLSQTKALMQEIADIIENGGDITDLNGDQASAILTLTGKSYDELTGTTGNDYLKAYSEYVDYQMEAFDNDIIAFKAAEINTNSQNYTSAEDKDRYLREQAAKYGYKLVEQEGLATAIDTKDYTGITEAGISSLESEYYLDKSATWVNPNSEYGFYYDTMKNYAKASGSKAEETKATALSDLVKNSRSINEVSSLLGNGTLEENWNKMDYYQQSLAATLLGASVEDIGANKAGYSTLFEAKKSSNMAERKEMLASAMTKQGVSKEEIAKYTDDDYMKWAKDVVNGNIQAEDSVKQLAAAYVLAAGSADTAAAAISKVKDQAKQTASESSKMFDLKEDIADLAKLGYEGKNAATAVEQLVDKAEFETTPEGLQTILETVEKIKNGSIEATNAMKELLYSAGYSSNYSNEEIDEEYNAMKEKYFETDENGTVIGFKGTSKSNKEQNYWAFVDWYNQMSEENKGMKSALDSRYSWIGTLASNQSYNDNWFDIYNNGAGFGYSQIGQQENQIANATDVSKWVTWVAQQTNDNKQWYSSNVDSNIQSLITTNDEATKLSTADSIASKIFELEENIAAANKGYYEGNIFGKTSSEFDEYVKQNKASWEAELANYQAMMTFLDTNYSDVSAAITTAKGNQTSRFDAETKKAMDTAKQNTKKSQIYDNMMTYITSRITTDGQINDNVSNSMIQKFAKAYLYSLGTEGENLYNYDTDFVSWLADLTNGNHDASYNYEQAMSKWDYGRLFGTSAKQSRYFSDEQLEAGFTAMQGGADAWEKYLKENVDEADLETYKSRMKERYGDYATYFLDGTLSTKENVPYLIRQAKATAKKEDISQLYQAGTITSDVSTFLQNIADAEAAAATSDEVDYTTYTDELLTKGQTYTKNASAIGKYDASQKKLADEQAFLTELGIDTTNMTSADVSKLFATKYDEYIVQQQQLENYFTQIYEQLTEEQKQALGFTGEDSFFNTIQTGAYSGRESAADVIARQDTMGSLDLWSKFSDVNARIEAGTLTEEQGRTEISSLVDSNVNIDNWIEKTEEAKEIMYEYTHGILTAEEAQRKLAKTMNRSSKTTAEYNQNAIKLNKSIKNYQYYLNKTSWNGDEKDEAASLVGYKDWDEAKASGETELSLRATISDLQIADLDDLQTAINNQIEAATGDITAIEMGGDLIVRDKQNVILEAGGNASEVLAGANAEMLEIAQAWADRSYTVEYAKFIQYDEDGNIMGYKYAVANTPTITGAGTSGARSSSGGGGGKSAADKLVEKWKHKVSDKEHVIKMVQAQETKYQEQGQLANYGNMLTVENKAQEDLISTQKQAIKEYKNQLKSVSAGSDDYYTLTDAIKSAEEAIEEAENAIIKNTKALKENRAAMRKTRTELEDYLKGILEANEQYEEQKLAGTVEMEDTILEAIKARYQEEWNLQKEDLEKKKAALEDEKELISERLQARKDAEDAADEYEEIAELQKQLALISMDSTRAAEAEQIRKQLAEKTNALAWEEAETYAETRQKELEDEANAIDEYISDEDERVEDYLADANNFSAAVKEVLGGTQDQIIQWLKDNVDAYDTYLSDAQEQQINQWLETYKQMMGITDTYWEQINNIIKGGWTAVAQEVMTSQDYINSSDTDKLQMLSEAKDKYDEYYNAYYGTSFTKSNFDTLTDSYITQMEEALASGDTEKLSNLLSSYETDMEGNATYSHSDNFTAGSSSSTTKNNTDAVKDNTDAQKALKSAIDETTNATKASSTTLSDFVKSVASGATSFVNAIGTGISNLTNIFKNVGSTSDDGTTRTRTMRTAADGGVFNYTGQVLVHGTNEHPEYIFNEDQLKALSKIGYTPYNASVGGDAFGSSNSIGDVSITINQAEIASDIDVQKLAEQVGEQFVQQISIQGYRTGRY